MKIKNKKKIAITETRKIGLALVEVGLNAIDTTDFIKKNVFIKNNFLFIKEKKFSLEKVDNFYIVGVGKCSAEAAVAFGEVLDKRLNKGIVLDTHFSTKKNKKIKIFKGSHPLATVENIIFTKKIINFLKKTTKKDFVLMIISGGGSALLCQPQNSTYKKEGEIIKCLMAKGASIEEINIVRKHLSLARGGFLAKYAYPAKVVSLIFSDVPGDKLEFIASGPTIKDTTTVADAKKILKKYNIESQIGFKVDFLIETPKEDKYFKRVENILFLSNKEALTAMAGYARSLGYKAKIKTNKLKGEAYEIGRLIVEKLRKEKSKTVLLYGGETTVKILGKGKGGRNQELVLSVLRFIADNELVIAFASDGRDNTVVAGAIADKLTKQKAEKLKLDINRYLANNNSYEFFQKTGDFIKTGDTGSNVSDLIIAIKN